MTTSEVVQAVEAWVTGLIPEYTSFGYAPEEIDQPLPVVAAEVSNDATEDTDPDLPGMGAYQQVQLRTWTLNVVLLRTADPVGAASTLLYSDVDSLGGSLRGGVQLAGNVVLSQYYDASYDPPEVEYNDGTIARQVTLTVVVGETIGA